MVWGVTLDVCQALGLFWMLRYYYSGVASWAWFYPHLYAPLLTDLVQCFQRPHLHTELADSLSVGSPFSPLAQLMAVCLSLTHPHTHTLVVMACAVSMWVIGVTSVECLCAAGSVRPSHDRGIVAAQEAVPSQLRAGYGGQYSSSSPHLSSRHHSRDSTCV